MPAYEQIGLLALQNAFHLRHIMTWVAADVGHVDIDVLDVEKHVLGILHAHNVIVDIAVHGAQRLELRQGIRGFNVANITCMPQLIHILEEVEKLRNQGAMRIR